MTSLAALVSVAAIARPCVLLTRQQDAPPVASATAAKKSGAPVARAFDWSGSYAWEWRGEPWTGDAGEPRNGRGASAASTLSLRRIADGSYAGRYERMGAWTGVVAMNVAGSAHGDEIVLRGRNEYGGDEETLVLSRASDAAIWTSTPGGRARVTRK